MNRPVHDRTLVGLTGPIIILSLFFTVHQNVIRNTAREYELKSNWTFTTTTVTVIKNNNNLYTPDTPFFTIHPANSYLYIIHNGIK